MTAHSISVERKTGSDEVEGERGGLRYVVPAARVLFAAIFVMSGANHFNSQTIQYAASHGVPMAHFVVPCSGLLALIGGLSVALGYRARFGAWLLVAFLIPVTLMMHNFWSVADPMMARMQQAMFMKNLSMLGGALLIAYFGPGPISLDAHDVFPHRTTAPPEGPGRG